MTTLHLPNRNDSQSRLRQYEAAKAKYIHDFPDATSREYQQTINELAKKFGV